MKIIVFLLVLTGLFACKSTEIKPQKMTAIQHKTESEDYHIQEEISVIPNQKLTVIKNELGQKDLKILPGQNIVLKYSYKQTPKDIGLMDANYTQNLWFEIKGQAIKTFSLTPKDLQKNPLYVQVYGFRNAKLITVTNADLKIKVTNQHKAELSIDIYDNNVLIRKKHIKQILKF